MAVSGKQLMAMLETGQAVPSDDRITIIHKASGDVLAHRIAQSNGTAFYKTDGDTAHFMAECVELCLKWEINKDLKLKVCVEWGCKE